MCQQLRLNRGFLPPRGVATYQRLGGLSHKALDSHTQVERLKLQGAQQRLVRNELPELVGQRAPRQPNRGSCQLPHTLRRTYKDKGKRTW